MVVVEISRARIFEIYKSENLNMIGLGSAFFAVLELLKDYCHKHCQGKFLHLIESSGIEFEFNDPRDAMMFKLAWM